MKNWQNAQNRLVYFTTNTYGVGFLAFLLLFGHPGRLAPLSGSHHHQRLNLPERLARRRGRRKITSDKLEEKTEDFQNGSYVR